MRILMLACCNTFNIVIQRTVRVQTFNETTNLTAYAADNSNLRETLLAHQYISMALLSLLLGTLQQ